MGSENDIRELAVIGGGPGGYAAAFHAADLGVKVTLIDKEENPGGVCLYRGCIPSKALLHAARVIKDAQKAKDFGIDFGEPEVDIDKLREWKNSVISKLVRGLGSLCKKRKIEYIQGTAEFTGKDRIRVQRTDKKAEEIGFKNAIVATGTHIISLPSIPMDSENVIDSDMSLEIKDVPESMLVIGGGYIGLEQANIYARLGSKVSVVEMTSQLLPGSDEELVSILTDYLKKECLEKVILNTKVSGIEETSEGIRVSFEGEAEESSGQTYQKVLVAVGRKPNTQGIGLENAGVKVDEKGFIPVNKQRRTNVNNIFAVGDITGDPQFAHKATHEGMIAGEVIAGRQAAFDVHAIPFVEYTELELAGCGLSEQQARERGIETQVTKFPWSASGRAWTLGEGKGLTKLVFEASSGRLLGVGIVGSDAGKLISEATVAIEMAATATDLARTIHPHPTLSETIMEAAENFLDGSISGG